jgi:starch synthase
MNIVFITPEVHPFQKHGGLADVSVSLPKALKQKKHHITTILPLYPDDPFQYKYTLLNKLDVSLGDHTEKTQFFTYVYNDIPHIFVKNSLFDTPNARDAVLKHLIFNVAAIDILPFLDAPCDILHLNDWQTSFIPFLLDSMYRHLPFYANIKTLLTIHNIERQGQFERIYEHLLPFKNFTYILNGKLNFLKTGIMRANYINTVSKTYKQEILQRFYGFELDDALKARQDRLEGILNGFDHQLYDPTTEKTLILNYDADTFIKGKQVNKDALSKDLNLTVDDTPMFIYIGRLAKQKGIDLMKRPLEEALNKHAIRLIVIGEGDESYERYFKELQLNFPSYVHYHQGFNQSLSQRAYASGDFFLLPSLFEPCGLNHMIAMRYATLPIVRETGGLKDTIFSDGNEQNGFTFKNFDEKEFKTLFETVLQLHQTQDPILHVKRLNAMHVTSHLDDMASSYEELYEKVLKD